MKVREGVPIVALIVSLAAVLVNYVGAQHRDVQAIRPVLVFEYQASGWTIHNVGAGPAMDVIFSRLRGSEVHEHVRLPALARDAQFPLHFAKQDNIHRFAVTYRDLDGRPYTSQSERDVSIAVSGFVAPRPVDSDVVPWWRLPERDS